MVNNPFTGVALWDFGQGAGVPNLLGYPRAKPEQVRASDTLSREIPETQDGSLGLCVVRALESPTCWGIHP